jgi:hypothetical protein
VKEVCQVISTAALITIAVMQILQTSETQSQNRTERAEKLTEVGRPLCEPEGITQVMGSGYCRNRTIQRMPTCGLSRFQIAFPVHDAPEWYGAPYDDVYRRIEERVEAEPKAELLEAD